MSPWPGGPIKVAIYLDLSKRVSYKATKLHLPLLPDLECIETFSTGDFLHVPSLPGILGQLGDNSRHADCWLMIAEWLLLIADSWVLIADCWVMIADCWLLSADCWLPSDDCWLLSDDCWLMILLIACCWVLIAECWLLSAQLKYKPVH